MGFRLRRLKTWDYHKGDVLERPRIAGMRAQSVYRDERSIHPVVFALADSLWGQEGVRQGVLQCLVEVFNVFKQVLGKSTVKLV